MSTSHAFWRACFSTFIIAATLNAVTPALAGNLRDDVVSNAGGISNIIELDPRFTPVVNIITPGIPNHCTGSLINTRTILTAAHCFDTFPASIALGISFTPTTTINAPDVLTGSYLVNPGYTNKTSEWSVNDVALLTLEKPIENITPVSLSPNLLPVGTAIISVGYGANGSGTLPAANSDGQLRTINNIIDIIENPTIGYPRADGNMYIADFDDPLLSSPNITGGAALANEGSPSFGDSGGPLFVVQSDGSLLQIGTVVGGINLFGRANSGYGSIAVWTPTATNYTWITQNNPLRNMTATSTGNWNDAEIWQGKVSQDNGTIPQNSPPGLSPTLKRFFIATIQDGTTTVIQNQTIDSVRVTSASAQLIINQGATFTTEGTSWLNNGNITVNGNFGAQAINMTGGSFSGSGVISTTNGVQILGGMVTPGNSIGTMKINGNYTQSANGTLQMELDGTTSDLLQVSGTATIGGNLELVLLPGGHVPANGTSYSLLQAGTLTGNWTTVRNSLPGTLDIIAEEKTATAYSLTIGRKSFNAILKSNGNKYTASALDALRGTAGTTDFFDSIDLLNGDALVQALNIITPGGPASGRAPLPGGSAALVGGQISARQTAIRNGTGKIEIASQINFTEQNRSVTSLDRGPNPVMTRITSAFDAAGISQDTTVDQSTQESGLPYTQPENGWSLLIASDTIIGNVANNIGGRDDYWQQAITIGADQRVGENTLIGASLSYLTGQTSPQAGGRVENSGIAITAYGSQNWDNHFWVDVFGACSLSELDINRVATVGATTLRADADTRSTSFLFGATIGYDIYLHSISFDNGAAIESPILTPVISLDYSHTKIDGYTETGSLGLASVVQSQEEDSLRTALGIQVTTIEQAEWGIWRPHLRAVWAHEFNPGATVVNSTFIGAPGSLVSSRGLVPDRNWLRLGAGITFEKHDGWSLDFSAETDLGRQTADRHRINLTARLAF